MKKMRDISHKFKLKNDISNKDMLVIRKWVDNITAINKLCEIEISVLMPASIFQPFP